MKQLNGQTVQINPKEDTYKPYPESIWSIRCIIAVASLAIASAQGGEFRFPVGLMFASGAYDAMDKLEETYPVSDEFVWPVGLSVNPYYEFNIGVGVRLSVGPSAIPVIDDPWGNREGVSLYCARERFCQLHFSTGQKCFALRLCGVRYPIAGGDYLKFDNIGAFRAVGVEFLGTKKVGFPVEASYDTSTVKIEPGPLGGEKKATFGGIMASLSAVF